MKIATLILFIISFLFVFVWELLLLNYIEKSGGFALSIVTYFANMFFVSLCVLLIVVFMISCLIKKVEFKSNKKYFYLLLICLLIHIYGLNLGSKL